MFQPKLGTSLIVISREIGPEMLQALAASRIATLEADARFLLDDQAAAKVAALREATHRAGIRTMTVHALFGKGYDFSVLDPQARAQALSATDLALEMAVALDAPMIVMHSSAEPVLPGERAQRIALVQQALAEIGERCRVAGKRIAIELLPRSCLGNTVEELLAILEPLDPETFGVCLDTNHLMDRHATLPDVVRQLGDRLWTLHMSDYDGIDEKHELPGTGVLDWRGFMIALAEIGYAGPFNYEANLDGATPWEKVEALQRNYDWLTSLA